MMKAYYVHTGGGDYVVIPEKAESLPVDREVFRDFAAPDEDRDFGHWHGIWEEAIDGASENDIETAYGGVILAVASDGREPLDVRDPDVWQSRAEFFGVNVASA